MINIPDPCQEDFSKMTSTERGAFCQKCETDTFDFRHLSNDEINRIILKHKGQHICGRINQSQLEELNAGFLQWKNQTNHTFQSKFLLACVIAFGLTLFSCSTEEKPVIQQMNQIEMTKNIHPQLNFINKDFQIENIDLLDYVIEELTPFTCNFGNMELAGDIAIDQEYQEYTETHYMTAGMIAYDPNYVNYVEEIQVDTTDESILAPPITNDPRVFEAKAYPNPTQSQSTVALDIEKEGQFDIKLYNINGQLVRNIHSGVLTSGRQQFEIDMYDLNSGMYFIKIISQGQNETLKIQKVN
ncbi:MAG: T9SS type A sorting domain-containing protein [Crocinitomicaceae bacterium]